jgi:YbbR domain-containing protein
VNLITNDWRLKLLAVGLGVLMLGAVAFSQNPPTTRLLTGVGLHYTVPPGLILINPPSKTDVTISGLANVIGPITSDNMVAVVDATHASPGPAVRLNITAKAPNSTVSVQNPPPILVNIDARQTKDLTVQVNARAAAGWRLTKAQALCPGADIPDPCTVHYDGPATWEINLTASVTIPGFVSVGTIDSPNQNIQLQNSNGVVDPTCRTVPCATLTPNATAVHIEAVSGSTSSTVPLVDAPPAHGPPPGYRVTGVTISPITVIVTGDPAALGRLQRILLPALDLSGRTSNVSFQVTIPYPPGVDGNTPNATVTYTIEPNPNVSPSPGP